ncbi:MAG: hypothetical protein QM753_02560 [Thermomicrobiales bacterium]
MTDDIQRMNERSPSSTPPGQPARTDALPSRDADALDAWLDAQALSSHDGAPAAPAPAWGQNGQWVRSKTGDASLADAASRFHARFAAAEEAEAPPTPVDAIWEQIMTTAHLTPASPPPPVPLASRASNPPARPERHPFMQTVGSHPALTAVLVAAVLALMVLVFREFDRNRYPTIIDYGPAALVTDGSATPSSSPATKSAIQLSTPDANGCIIRTLSPEEEAVIANLSALPTPDYTVTGPLDDEAITRDAATAWASAFGCNDVPLANDQEAGAVSLLLLATVRQGRLPETRIPLNEQRLTVTEALSSTLVEQNPTRYIVDSNDPAMAPWLGTAGNGRQYVILPQDMVRFADGRIGAPIKLARPGGAGTTTKDSYMSPQTVTYVFFRQEGGIWLIDEQLSLCTWKCDEYFAARQRDIDADRAPNGLSTPVARPEATATSTMRTGGDNLRPGTETPDASPASPAADVWLQPIALSECTTPLSTATADNDRAALLARQYIACVDAGTPASAIAPQVFSTSFLERHPEMPNDQLTTTDADIDRGEAISTVVASANPTIMVMGIPGADDQSSRTQGFYEVFLPQQNTIQLDNGQFAIPMSIAFTDEARATAAATAVAQGDDTPYTVAVVVFTVQDGSPRIDDLLLACIANCDGFWEQQRSQVGTPSPSNEQIATEATTATAVAEAKLPIPASECVVPTVAAGSESLPERQYAPPLKPTDANATAVTSDARAGIACRDAAPSENIDDVLAPFETERFRNERTPDDYQPPTTEQIEASKRISAYLEGQGVTTFSERAPADVVDPGVSDWPGVMGPNGELADVTPGWYTVPMPGVAVQFPDGRIGIPMMQMITNDDLWALHQEQAATQTGGLWVFAKVGDTWLLDEGLALCIGDCETFWQDAAAPSGDSQWLRPVSASECQPVSASTYREYVRPRDDTIVNTQGRPDVARQSRTWVACSPNGSRTNTTIDQQFETQRFADEGGIVHPLTDEQISRAKKLSAHYADAGYQIFQRAPEGIDLVAGSSAQIASFDGLDVTYAYIFQPDDAIGFADGRVAIPVTILLADGGGWTAMEAQPAHATLLTIWAQVGDTWLLDETLPICIGDCAEFWELAPTLQPAIVGPVLSLWLMAFTMSATTPEGTPQAIPLATPSASDTDLAYWLARPSAGVCKPPTTAGATGLPEREYLPWTQADASTGEAVSLTDRARLACSNSQALIPNSGFYTSRYELPSSPGSAVDADALARMQELSAAIPEQDPAAWVRQGQTSTASPTGDATRRYAVLPANVYRLPDGRYAAIPVTVATDPSAIEADAYLAFPIAIYARSGDTWQLDEQVTVCLGDCESFWSGFHVIDSPAVPPIPPASPVASGIIPIDRRALAVA